MGQDQRVVFYPDKVRGWRKLLIIIFCIIGCLTVLNWAIGVFADAGRFWLVEPRKKVVFNRGTLTEKTSVIGEVAQAASNDAVKDGPGNTINEEVKEVDSSASSAYQIEKEIEKQFGSDSKVAKAIFKTESALNPRAKNYNCYYDGKSQSCRPGDEEKAWSVDCGIAQINVMAKECPEDLFDYKNNIRVAKRDLFDKRGFQPWVTFNEKYYLANL